jgi:hypothetical protein
MAAPSPNDSQQSNGIPPLKKRRSRPWHRVLGMIAVLPLIWVMLTGVMLNHTLDWKLDRIQLNHPWILSAYGMTPTGEPVGLTAGSHQIAEWDGQIFLDAKPLEVSGSLIGAVADGDGIAVVTSSAILRLDASGSIVELLDGASIPAAPLQAVAHQDGKTLLRNADGWHEAGVDWLDFTERDEDAEFVEQMLSPLENETARTRLRTAWTHGGLPASRVVLDLHAGKFLGAFSKYFYDVVAVCTLWLCLTGVILFVRKPRRIR